ncbi:MAG TPA: N-6 DNA methylase [Actinomycetota bacterium]|nr:N-6 DNA methylase [Actinomycetota bacterium]
MTSLAVRNPPDVDPNKRKRLGQFFTGELLARLLAALAEARTATSVIDPMAGSGDMLKAVQELSNEPLLTGIEIDPSAAALCASRLYSRPEVTVAVGDAFSSETWASVPNRTWDLVITNPPYVRYQRGARQSTGRLHIPSAKEVREGLIHLLSEELVFPSDDVRNDFLVAARNFSGLADLAVPAWILCAALVAPGGRLAMIVPDTWLSRNYALPVLYLLTRYFEVEAVVEDGEASWFEDALVRTTLFVARRRPEVGGLASVGSYVHIRLSPEAGDAHSLVGRACDGAVDSENQFADLIHQHARGAVDLDAKGVEVQKVPLLYFHELMESLAAETRWLGHLHNGSRSVRFSTQLPRRALSVIDDASQQMRSIQSYGWSIGQGLRTGANRFFYGTCVAERAGSTLVAVDPVFGLDPVEIPNDALRHVIRKQEDLSQERRNGRLIALWDYVLPEDAEQCRRLGVACPYQEMAPSLAEYVRAAQTVNLGTEEAPRWIPRLSAVVTNERRPDRRRPEMAPRFWYQLPSLAPRHVPELFTARVNYHTPIALLNQPETVIDANFTTFWRPQEDALHPLIMLAILRSTWVKLMLETSGTVLGGGALKVEAAHLRRLPLPPLSEHAQVTLLRAGQGLLEGQEGSSDAIDEALWSNLPGVQPEKAHALLVDVKMARGQR